MIMSVFDDIELPWAGSTFVIKSNRVMGAIARIEDAITLAELQAYAVKGAAPIGKLSMAYAAVLRYAGARVTDEEVYEKSFAGDREQEAMILSIMNLMKLMLPPSARAKMEAAMNDIDGEGDAEPGNSPAAAKASSRKPSKRRSRANG
jgi:hypothetical protein